MSKEFLVFFVDYIGPSVNKLNTMFKKRYGNKVYDPKEKFIKIYVETVSIAIDEFNLEYIESPIYVSYFPISGDCIQTGEKQKKRAYDCDNYQGITKMIQDRLKNAGIIEDDDNKHIKSHYVHMMQKSKIKRTGMFLVIEKVSNQQFPDIGKHYKEVEKMIKKMESKL